MIITWRSFAHGKNTKELHDQSKKMKSWKQRKVTAIKFEGTSHAERTQNLHNQKFKKEI